MTTSDRCSCGKPREHLDADPDSDAWACRVPDPSESSTTSQREKAATYQTAWYAGYDAGRASVLEQMRDELLPQLRKLSTTVAAVADVFDTICTVTR